MERRALLAITLSLLVIMTYPYFLAKLHPPSQAQSQGQTKEPILPVQIPSISNTKPTIPLKSDEKWSVETTNTKITMTNMGAHISQIQLNEYKDISGESPIELLTEQDNITKGPLSTYFWNYSTKADIPEAYVYERTGNIYTLQIENGLKITKEFQFDQKKYLTTLDLTIKNDSNEPKEVGYKILCSSKLRKSDSVNGEEPTEAYLLMNGKPHRVGLYRLSSPKQYQGRTDWVAYKNKYFCIILKPQDKTSSVFINPLQNKGLQIGCDMEPVRIEGGSQIAHRFFLYAGPADYHILRSSNGEGFEKIVGLNNIGLLLLDILKFFHKIVHNYGVSIILLTLLVSIVLYPLTLKSLKSMRKIQELQPKIEKLRQEYKDNPQHLNKELLEVYKKHRVNPLGGCLPILLQMPVFIALYQTLSRALELRHAGFLWIKDLSGPDKAFHLPFSLPILGDSVNLLPLLMMFAMIFQQKLSQGPSAPIQPEQKMMAAIMPIMFGVMFYNLPSGLVLYWLTNTIIMIGCYGFIKKPHPQ